MLILVGHATTPDEIDVVTGSAADVDVHVSYIDCSDASPPIPDPPNKTNTLITTATTTAIVTAPTNAAKRRNVKTIHIFNKDTIDSTDITVIFDANAGGSDVTLHKANLAPGEALEYAEGVGWFEIAASPAAVIGTNRSTGSQAFSTTDAYVTGSSIALAALGTPVVGLFYDCSFDMVKSAGTGAMVVTVRVGTAGTTADTARLTFTMDAGTSVADVATFVVRAMFRTVGSGTSAVLQGRITMANSGLTATGFRDATPTLGIQQVTSGGFDSTVANSIIGVSFNGATAFSGTSQLVEAELIKR